MECSLAKDGKTRKALIAKGPDQHNDTTCISPTIPVLRAHTNTLLYVAHSPGAGAGGGPAAEAAIGTPV